MGLGGGSIKSESCEFNLLVSNYETNHVLLSSAVFLLGDIDIITINFR